MQHVARAKLHPAGVWFVDDALPGPTACVLFTVLMIGPFATHLSLRLYLLNGQTFRYLGNILLLPQRTLRLVFEGQQWGGSVNPMLWTLLAGTMVAARVPIAAGLVRRSYPAMLPVFLLVLGDLDQFLTTFPDSRWFRFLHLDIRLVLAEAPFFFGGMSWQYLDHDEGIDTQDEATEPQPISLIGSGPESPYRPADRSVIDGHASEMDHAPVTHDTTGPLDQSAG